MKQQPTWEYYLLLNPDLDLDQINNIIDTYIQIVNKHGSFISKEIWGEKNLAYPIEKNKKAYKKAYYYLNPYQYLRSPFVI